MINTVCMAPAGLLGQAGRRSSRMHHDLPVGGLLAQFSPLTTDSVYKEPEVGCCVINA